MNSVTSVSVFKPFNLSRVAGCPISRVFCEKACPERSRRVGNLTSSPTLPLPPPHDHLLAAAPVSYPRTLTLRRSDSRIAMQQRDLRRAPDRDHQIRQRNSRCPALTPQTAE